MLSRRGLRLLLAAAALLLAGGCGMIRVVYNNADTVLRFMARDYGDLDSTQTDQMRAALTRLHEWHRVNELPLYAALAKDAGRRIARGATAEDVAWAIAGVRARYRQLIVRAAEETAPVVATLGPAQLVALDHKFAEDNRKYAKEYLSADEKKRLRAQLKRTLEHFRDFLGDLTPEQEARIERFVKAGARHAVLRFEDRQRWQHDVIALIRQHRRPRELGERLGELFAVPEARRAEEYLREDRRWEGDLAHLVVDLDRTLSPKQRARAVKRFETYAEDFTVLAARKKDRT